MRNTFGHEAEVNHLTRQTPNGPVETYVVLVTRNVVALALQTGLVDRRKQQVRGLPSEVVNGSIAQIKAAWRGAFMARGFLSDPGKASFLEIACPTEEAAMALCGVARRLGIQAKHRTLRSSERVTLKDPDAILLIESRGGLCELLNGESADIGDEWTAEQLAQPRQLMRDHVIYPRILKPYRIEYACGAFGDSRCRIAEAGFGGRSLERDRSEDVQVIELGIFLAVAEGSACRNHRAFQADT